MSDEIGAAVAAQPALAAARGGVWRRFVDRFLPAAERRDAFWLIGVATSLGVIRAVAYQPLQRTISGVVFSPRVEELGFALRATAIADVAWGVFAGVFILLVFRFTKAPKATALYIVLAGLALTAIALGNRLALNAVMALSGSEYTRSLWSDLQPLMLSAAEAVGVSVAVWVAQLMSGEERPADGSTFLPAMGWTGTPLVGAAWLAVAYVVVRATCQLATTVVSFVPLAYAVMTSAKGTPLGPWSSALSVSAAVGSIVLVALIVYLALKRLGAPVTVWLAFLGGAIPSFIATLSFLPNQFAAMEHGSGRAVQGFGSQARLALALSLVALALVSLALSFLASLIGVWFATRPARVSESSATLPEDNDHW